MKKTFFSLFLSLPLMLSAQVSEFRPGIVADGVNYVLPRTGVRADVTVYKTIYTPGEYARYADRYMHLKNISAETHTSYSIKSINIYQYGEPDTLKYYTIKLKDKSVAPLAQLTPEGFLVSINTNVPVSSPKQPETIETHNKLDSHQYFTSEILAASSSVKMAELVAQEIMDIRESKNSIRRGQVESMPKDGASLKILLDELDQQAHAEQRYEPPAEQCSRTQFAVLFAVDEQTDEDDEEVAERLVELGRVFWHSLSVEVKNETPRKVGLHTVNL